MSADDRRRELREAFVEARGFWSPLWEGLLELDPDFFEAYIAFSSVPWRSGPLEPKVKELIYLAMDAAATHLFEPGIRQHVRNAIGQGATAAELMEVLELTSTLGIHACNIGVPILVEELEAAGQSIDRELDDRRREVKADFEAKRGYWHPFWDDILALDRLPGGLELLDEDRHTDVAGVDAQRARQLEHLHELLACGPVPDRVAHVLADAGLEQVRGGGVHREQHQLLDLGLQRPVAPRHRREAEIGLEEVGVELEQPVPQRRPEAARLDERLAQLAAAVVGRHRISTAKSLAEPSTRG